MKRGLLFIVDQGLLVIKRKGVEVKDLYVHNNNTWDLNSAFQRERERERERLSGSRIAGEWELQSFGANLEKALLLELGTEKGKVACCGGAE